MKTFKIVSGALVALALAACGGAGSGQDAPKAAPKVVESPKDMAERDMQAGIKAGGEGNWAVAAQKFATARKLAPKRVDVIVNHGIALERSGDPIAAADAYSDAHELDPADSAAAANLARVLIATKKYKQARKVLKESLTEDPESAVLLNMSASLQRQTKNYKKAAALARRVLLRNQKNIGAIKTLALVYADQGKLQLADTFFRNALKLNDKDASIYVNLGLLDYRRDRHQRALANFEKAIALDPQNATAHANVGAIALRYRDYGRASTSYKTAIDAGLVTCETVSALGYSYEGKQDGANAVRELKRAYDLCPDDAELLYSVGTICMAQLQDNSCALENFERYSKTKKALAKDHPVHLMIESIRQMEQQQATPPPAEEGADADEQEQVGQGNSALSEDRETQVAAAN
ncbi:MAG: tetratricopeptide repeat protein [Myxococcota bacterium]